MSDLEQRTGPPAPLRNWPSTGPVSRQDPGLLARILQALLADQPVAGATGTTHGYRKG